MNGVPLEQWPLGQDVLGGRGQEVRWCR
jgi:hypothetical protein